MNALTSLDPDRNNVAFSRVGDVFNSVGDFLLESGFVFSRKRFFYFVEKKRKLKKREKRRRKIG